VRSAQIASDLDCDYEAVLNFRHDLQELCGELDELTLSDVCEADEIYVTTGEKGVKKKDESPRSRGLKKGRGSFESDKLPVVTLVRLGPLGPRKRNHEVRSSPKPLLLQETDGDFRIKIAQPVNRQTNYEQSCSILLSSFSACRRCSAWRCFFVRWGSSIRAYRKVSATTF